MSTPISFLHDTHQTRINVLVNLFMAVMPSVRPELQARKRSEVRRGGAKGANYAGLGAALPLGPKGQPDKEASLQKML